MSNTVKDINIKIHTYCFFDKIINIKDFDPNNVKIDEKSYKNIHSICDNQRFKIRKNWQC